MKLAREGSKQGLKNTGGYPYHAAALRASAFMEASDKWESRKGVFAVGDVVDYRYGVGKVKELNDDGSVVVSQTVKYYIGLDEHEAEVEHPFKSAYHGAGGGRLRLHILPLSPPPPRQQQSDSIDRKVVRDIQGAWRRLGETSSNKGD